MHMQPNCDYCYFSIAIIALILHDVERKGGETSLNMFVHQTYDGFEISFPLA